LFFGACRRQKSFDRLLESFELDELCDEDDELPP
jgi:hypothetical protein